ncbi:ribonuclease III [Polaromonas naphthalenivorans]|uniref:Ribonuclease 3 n=1 Tax=Polaromonas naphthalenivorans (strain CJ2) TaxID=365044 RepID=A1VRT2_POLNA|nr:ribonuclease III [Polaromonas naphthalenivorans]ABM38360.1 RNAse III [Polaromonas naphthalenivorans CJ2]
MRSTPSSSPALQALQKRLQHEFAKPKLLVQALTHRSFSSDHNERIEFLGDSVLNLAVAGLLYEQLSELPEGDLSRVRANLVKQDTLHQLAVVLGLPDLLRLGEGEARSGGKNRPSMLADALEAVIGAVYLDAGYDQADQLVRRLFKDVQVNPQMKAIGKDPKTELQEWLQGRKMRLPLYKVVSTMGAAHQQTFEVECEIAEFGRAERGIGVSRRAGEQAAATAMLLFVKTLAS